MTDDTETFGPKPFVFGVADERDRMFTVENSPVGEVYFVLRWGGYPYEINLAEIQSGKELLGWVVHLGEKDWKDMTPWRTAKFIKAVCQRKKWNLYDVGGLGDVDD